MKIPWPNNLPLTALSGVALSAVLVASACSVTEDATGPTNSLPDLVTDSETILLSASLDTVDTCDGLLERIQQDALERVGPYGLDQPGFYAFDTEFDEEAIDEDFLTETEASDAGADEDSAAAPAPQAEQRMADSAEESTANTAEKETSGTNNQEEGVDEADLVKSDGSTLAIVSGSELRVLDVTGDTPRLTKTIRLSRLGQPTGMFLNGDRLVLLSVDYSRNGQPTSLVTDVDLRSGTVGGSAEFEGQYVSSREVDGSLRLVLSSTPTGIDFVYPDGRTDETQAELENRELIERSELDDWIPEYRITGEARRQAAQPLVDCAQVHIPKSFSGGGQVVVVTVDIDRPLDVTDALAVHTDVQTVYASTDRLVVAAPEWPELSDPSTSSSFASPFRTALHSFDIGDQGATDYVASGSVRGLLLNQFSLSEHDGNLRVATTDSGQAIGWGVPIFDEEFSQPMSESFVTILSEQDEALVPLGQVGGLGRGEEIFAVRFIGDVGYVVTFRQTDPLYTVDLSDPSSPEVLGELKIPGFSNYLHEIDDRTLMGIGSDGTDEGQVLGAAVSLFDVEDLSDPTRLDKLAFDQNSSTPISYDAKAFTYWAKTNTAIVPIESYGPETGFVEEDGYWNDGFVSQAAVIDVDPEVGRVELRGTIDHRNRCDRPSSTTSNRRVPRAEAESESVVEAPEPAPSRLIDEEEYYEPVCESPYISRTMIIGDDIYTFSSAGIAVHSLDELREKAWVSFN